MKKAAPLILVILSLSLALTSCVRKVGWAGLDGRCALKAEGQETQGGFDISWTIVSRETRTTTPTGGERASRFLDSQPDCCAFDPRCIMKAWLSLKSERRLGCPLN